MNTFEYLAVLVSIIVGLGVAHILEKAGRLVSQPGTERLYWIHSIWVLYTLTWLVYFWWFELGFRSVEVWTAPLYIFVVGYAILLYLLCVIIVPAEPQADYREYYFGRRRWIFGFLLAVQLYDAVDTLLKPSMPVHYAPVGGLGGFLIMGAVFVVLFGTAMVTKKVWYHGAFAVVWALRAIASFLFRPEAGLTP